MTANVHLENIYIYKTRNTTPAKPREGRFGYICIVGIVSKETGAASVGN